MKVIRLLYFIFLALLFFTLVYGINNGPINRDGDPSNDYLYGMSAFVSLLGIITTSLIIVIGTFRKDKKLRTQTFLTRINHP